MRLDHLLSREYGGNHRREHRPTMSVTMWSSRPYRAGGACPLETIRRALTSPSPPELRLERERPRCPVLKDASSRPLSSSPAPARSLVERTAPLDASQGATALLGLRRLAKRPATKCRYAGANLENYIAAKVIKYSQDIKGQRRMPWRQKPMKDVDGCDKPR